MQWKWQAKNNVDDCYVDVQITQWQETSPIAIEFTLFDPNSGDNKYTMNCGEYYTGADLRCVQKVLDNGTTLSMAYVLCNGDVSEDECETYLPD